MRNKKSKTPSAKTASSAKLNLRGSKNGNRTTASSRSSRAEPTSGSERSTLDPQRSRTLRSEDEISENVSGRLSGDLQSLSNEETTSESVEELAEEGQDLESELLEGIEDAPAADQGAVRTHRSAEPEDKEIPSFKNRNRL
jgi:hypothetical protein